MNIFKRWKYSFFAAVVALVVIGVACGVPTKNVEFTVGDLMGGPVKASASQEVGKDVRWILPGLRNLDPAIFGTPDQPLGYEADIGLPLMARLTNEDGTAYTTTAMPTPFSDQFMQVTGSFSLEATDATFIDGASTEDEVDFTATFTGPDGKEYSIRVSSVLPMGPDHSFLGGVGTNFIHHGGTGIGTKLMPQVYTYVAFWGRAEFSIDGQVVATNRLVHAMVTNNVRDENYQIVFDEGVDNSKLQLHLILPPIELTPQGPQDSPLPTGFILPNGMEQPFLHIMFEDVSLGSAEVVQ